MKVIFVIIFATAWSAFVEACIEFNESLIPRLDGAWPIFSLQAPAKIPAALMNQTILASAPNATFRDDPISGNSLAYDDDRLVAFVHNGSGETRVFPNLQNLIPIKQINISLAYIYIQNKMIFPEDNIKFAIVNGSSLTGSIQEREKNVTAPEKYLVHAGVQRNITHNGQNFSVCGPGSVASFGFAADGRVHSLSYIWKGAAGTKLVANPDPVSTVYQSILDQLYPSSETSHVRVDGVDVCYYDSGLQYMQPVYRFWATLHAEPVASNITTPVRILGYLPIGDGSPEAVPALNQTRKQPNPNTPSGTTLTRNSPSPQEVIGEIVRPNVAVGRYVVRDDSSQWVSNANDFLTGLHGQFGVISIPQTLANFQDQQYFWAEPRLFTSEKDSFINKVHIAETEVHGNWDFFTTEKNCCDGVHIGDIPSSGYGGGSGGSLAYWIIHSCEVIPTTTDYSPANYHEAFDKWWNVFNGLHAIVGYRTEMWIGDGVTRGLGLFLGLGAPFVSTWLQMVYVSPSHYFWADDTMYLDQNRKIWEPMGRPSAVVVCGHEDDNVLQLNNLGRPACLREFWYEN